METVEVIKGFSALKMKEEIQAANYERTKNMSWEEVAAYRKSRIASDPFWGKLMQRSKA
jgi:hypothetical protein